MQQLFQADLSGVSLPDLLGLIHRGRQSGVLVLESDAAETKIFVEEGRPVSAQSTQARFRLGTLLESSGQLSRETIQGGLRSHDTSPLRLGQRLVADGHLSEAELLAALKVQASSILFDAFSWSAGSAAFFGGVAVPIKAIRIDLDVHSLLMEGVRRLDSAGLGVGPTDRGRSVEALVSRESLKQTSALTEAEWRILFLVDGRRSIDDIVRLADLGDDDQALGIIERMLLARFLRLGAQRPADEGVAIQAEPGPGTRELRGVTAPPSQVELGAGGSVEPVADDDRRHVVKADAMAYGERIRRVTMSRLMIRGQGDEVTSFPLNRDSYALGRHRGNDIVITDPKVSGFHARLDRTSDGFSIADLKSRNGTWVNGKRVSSIALAHGDEISVGAARLHYVIDYESKS